VGYRRQAPPDGPLESPVEGVRDPVSVRRTRMALRRGEVGLEPGRHASLGLEAYVQVTSPLRRYQDLVAHRQIGAILRGDPPIYGAEALRAILATTERAEADARRAERAGDAYWTLRYLEAATGTEVEALVVQVEPRPVVQLTETLWEQPMNGLSGVTPGQVIRARVERVNPRAGVLALRRVG
jgi:exoribonuclease-2